MKICTLSTSDNPHSPFDDYRAWYEWDTAHGYYTSEFLGRLVYTADSLTEDELNRIVEQTVDEIVEENVLGIYIKVEKEVEDQ